jgi:hypothetical protein
LITSAGVELEDVGGSLSMGAFSSFLKNQSFDSALWRSTHPDLAEWTSTLKTNLILADIYDLLAQINSNMVGGFSHKKPSKAKPYPRSWLKKTKEKKFGKGALPKNKLREWIKNYRRKES